MTRSFARFAFPLVLTFAAACADSATAPRSLPPHRPSLGTYDASRPAPLNVSAVLIGSDNARGLDSVQVTFTDVATDEARVNAYFLPTATLAAATQSIMGTALATGERTVVVVVESGHTQVELWNIWGTIPGDGSDIVWGKFSDVVDIGGVVTATTAACKPKGRCK